MELPGSASAWSWRPIAELDAFVFQLYGIEDRSGVDYILQTFPDGDQ
jgi:hypothetical protein